MERKQMVEQLRLNEKEAAYFESVGLFHEKESILYTEILAGKLHSLTIFGNEFFFYEGKRITENEFYTELAVQMENMDEERKVECYTLLESYKLKKKDPKEATCTVYLRSLSSCFACNPASSTNRYYVYGTIASVGSIYFDWYENILTVQGTIVFRNPTYICSDGQRYGWPPSNITIKFGEYRIVDIEIVC